MASPAREEWLVENAHRAMQFSAAAYGWSMLNHMASIFNLNFMPTSHWADEWKAITTPRASTPTTGGTLGRSLTHSRLKSSERRKRRTKKSKSPRWDSSHSQQQH